MRILVVEDDVMIARGLRTALQQGQHTVDCLANGQHALAALEGTTFDLVLLDLGLPGRDGLEVLRAVRRDNNRTPVIILTARDAVEQRITGLDAGADDYLVKPFDLDELMARIRSVQRRNAGRADSIIVHGDLRLNEATRAVELRGEPIALSAHEYAVLAALLLRPGIVLSRSQLEERLYGYDQNIASNAVQVYIHGLRRKLGVDSIRPRRGVGYFVPKP